MSWMISAAGDHDVLVGGQLRREEYERGCANDFETEFIPVRPDSGPKLRGKKKRKSGVPVAEQQPVLTPSVAAIFDLANTANTTPVADQQQPVLVPSVAAIFDLANTALNERYGGIDMSGIVGINSHVVPHNNMGINSHVATHNHVVTHNNMGINNHVATHNTGINNHMAVDNNMGVGSHVHESSANVNKRIKWKESHYSGIDISDIVGINNHVVATHNNMDINNQVAVDNMGVGSNVATHSNTGVGSRVRESSVDENERTKWKESHYGGIDISDIVGINSHVVTHNSIGINNQVGMGIIVGVGNHVRKSSVGVNKRIKWKEPLVAIKYFDKTASSVRGERERKIKERSCSA